MLLYPRLLRPRAKVLAAEYRDLTLDVLAGRVRTQDDSAVFVATGGSRVSEDRLRLLRASVMELAEAAGYPGESTTSRRSAFDLQLARMLHREMRIAPAEAAAGDVWAFLALILLPDAAKWRFPRFVGDRVQGTDLTRHFLARLWWRAQLVFAPSDHDPYAALEILGEAAFDQIYARRISLGGSPHLIKSILRVWDDADFTGLPERDVLRDFLKRLLRLAPLVSFDALEASALQEEFANILRESAAGVSMAGGMTPANAEAVASRILVNPAQSGLSYRP